MGEYLRLLATGRVRLDNMIQEPFPIDQAEEAYGRLSGEGAKPLLVLLKYPQRDGATNPVLQVSAPAPIDGRIKMALVGAGGFAQGMHLPNLQKLKDKFDLRTVVSRTGLSARSAAERFGIATAATDYQTVLDDPQIDLVLIATRHDLHAEMTLAALKAGKHVFVEKPLSMTEEGLDAIEAFYAANPKGPLLMTGFNRRFAPAIVAAQAAVKDRDFADDRELPHECRLYSRRSLGARTAWRRPQYRRSLPHLRSLQRADRQPAGRRAGHAPSFRRAITGVATTISSRPSATPTARSAR